MNDLLYYINFAKDILTTQVYNLKQLYNLTHIYTLPQIRWFTQFVISKYVPLLEGLIISDGIMNSIKFSKEYICYKITEKTFVTKEQEIKYKEDLLMKYNTLYTLSTIDRYVLYTIIHLQYMLLSIVLKPVYMDNFVYMFFMLFTIPEFQNMVINNRYVAKYVTDYLKNKQMFIRYSISKLIINFIQNLDNSIANIKNYQIFILYRYLSFDLLYDVFKSYLLIYGLHLLRSMESTYYYYKAIKLAYYYKSGYLFNVVTKEDSIYIINVVINEKRWFDISKLEIVHAFYCLISEKFNKSNDSTNLSFYFIKFCTLWSIICLIKIFTIQLNTLLIIGYLTSVLYKKSNDNSSIKRVPIVIVVYLLVLLNTNDLIISSICVGYEFIYYLLKEIFFFIYNLDDIKKILKFYHKKSREKKRKILENEWNVVN